MAYIAYKNEDGEFLSEETVEESYRAMLDDAYGPVSVAGYDWDTSRALELLDPIAYRVGLSDYTSEYEEYSFDDFDEYLDAVEG